MEKIFWYYIKCPLIRLFQRKKIFETCKVAASQFGKDNMFNLACFANSAKILGLDIGNGDGNRCRAILKSNSFVERVFPGDSHYCNRTSSLVDRIKENETYWEVVDMPGDE